MILTIPARMGQTLIISHRLLSFSLGRELKVRVTVVSVKPMRVSPAELGIYPILITPGIEVELHCHSEAREAKERAMLDSAMPG